MQETGQQGLKSKESAFNPLLGFCWRLLIVQQQRRLFFQHEHSSRASQFLFLCSCPSLNQGDGVCIPSSSSFHNTPSRCLALQLYKAARQDANLANHPQPLISGEGGAASRNDIMVRSSLARFSISYRRDLTCTEC